MTPSYFTAVKQNLLLNYFLGDLSFYEYLWWRDLLDFEYHEA